jgi:hypothetical protein
LAGCGLRRGAVHGATAANPKLDRDKPLQDVSDVTTVADIHATILSSLGIDPKEELVTPIGRPIKRSEGNPLESIMA